MEALARERSATVELGYPRTNCAAAVSRAARRQDRDRGLLEEYEAEGETPSPAPRALGYDDEPVAVIE